MVLFCFVFTGRDSVVTLNATTSQKYFKYLCNKCAAPNLLFYPSTSIIVLTYITSLGLRAAGIEKLVSIGNPVSCLCVG